jgi:hypothetical protein
LAKRHFEELGLKTVRFRSPLESELGKLFCTTYYGWNIIFSKYLYEVCQKQHADYDQVYIKFNRIYNQGYQKTIPDVMRPVLKHVPGPIGGHCVIPNAEILNDCLADSLSGIILKANEEAKTETGGNR